MGMMGRMCHLNQSAGEEGDKTGHLIPSAIIEDILYSRDVHSRYFLCIIYTRDIHI